MIISPLWLIVLGEINKISELSITEYIQINANWMYLKNEKQFNCQEQYKKLKDQKLEVFKNRNGCGLRIQKEPRQTVGFINFHSCFCDHLHSDFSNLLYLFNKYREGTLPFEGPLNSQPNHVIEVFRLLERLYSEHEQELLAEQEKKRKK